MKHLPTGVVIAALLIGLSQLAQADLKPQEIAILAATGNRGSERLAEYYAEQRGIPTENICKVIVPNYETITHEKWRWGIRPEIRKWLLDNDPKGNLRCLVTTWGIPLRVEKDKPDNPRISRYREFLEGEYAKRIKLLRDMVAEFGLLAPGISPDDAGAVTKPPKPTEGSKESSELDQLQAELETELQQAQARIRELSDPEIRKSSTAQVQSYASAVGGIQILLESLNKSIAANDNPANPLKLNFERLRGMSIAYTEMQQKLDRLAPNIERDSSILDILTRTRGLIASVKWIDEQLRLVKRNETNSSFDSELSLVLWPDDDYQLLRWQPNYLRPEFNNSQLRESYPTLMVSRIDAPTLPLAKALIDTAIEVEKTGLEGKVYIDARGIGKLDRTNVAPGSYPDFDRALLITAKGMQVQTSLEVILDEQGELFQPGDCPDAALYCGWYSLGKYVDAFEWKPGAVAYHMASAEATTLRNEDSQVWCKRMLEEGVCATMGPVYEPYLIAFPRPNEFFSLLLQGRLSLVECYYRTKPFNSWMMTLIGDPLYRPFGKSVLLK
ncbi:MAG: TIGR03790 family protein [Planctomycetota bacterium]